MTHQKLNRRNFIKAAAITAAAPACLKAAVDAKDLTPYVWDKPLQVKDAVISHVQYYRIKSIEVVSIQERTQTVEIRLAGICRNNTLTITVEEMDDADMVGLWEWATEHMNNVAIEFNV